MQSRLVACVSPPAPSYDMGQEKSARQKGGVASVLHKLPLVDIPSSILLQTPLQLSKPAAFISVAEKNQPLLTFKHPLRPCVEWSKAGASGIISS